MSVGERYKFLMANINQQKYIYFHKRKEHPKYIVMNYDTRSFLRAQGQSPIYTDTSNKIVEKCNGMIILINESLPNDFIEVVG